MAFKQRLQRCMTQSQIPLSPTTSLSTRFAAGTQFYPMVSGTDTLFPEPLMMLMQPHASLARVQNGQIAEECLLCPTAGKGIIVGGESQIPAGSRFRCRTVELS